MSRLLPTLVVAAWGFNVVANRLALRGLDPPAILAWRFLLAALLFLLLFACRAIPFRALDRTYLPRLLAVALVAVVVGNHAMLVGQTLLPASLVALLLQAAPLFTLIAESVMGTRRLTARGAAACGLGLAGAALAVGGTVSGGSAWGVAVTLLAPASVAAYLVLVRPLAIRYGSANVTGQIYVVGGLGFAAVAALTGSFHVPSAAPATVWGAVAWLGIAGTVLSWMAWGRVLARVPAGRAALHLNLVPVFGVAFSALFLGEALSPGLVLGGALAVAGVTMVPREGGR